MSAGHYHFNGINASTGQPHLPPRTAAEIAEIVFSETVYPSADARVKQLNRQFKTNHRGVIYGVDPSNLAEAGWAVIFAAETEPEIKEALAPLLRVRQAQAGSLAPERYRELTYQEGETGAEFLDRHQVCWGPADPDQMPYYLLLVGGPEAIPLSFQYELCQYAVGRICFQSVAEYEAYAEQVIRERPRRADKRSVFFGPEHREDFCTVISRRYLIDKLAESLQAQPDPSLKLETVTGSHAHKRELLELMQGSRAPDLLFTATHGLYVGPENPRYPTHMGALICAEWPGPTWKKALPDACFVSVDDLGGAESPRLAFLFACYSGGTNQYNDFSEKQQEIATHTFMAALPTKLLGMGTGAVVAHMGSAYGYSFMDRTYKHPQLPTFLACFQQLHQGLPVGLAMEVFRQRYASLHTHLAHCRERERLKQHGKREIELAELWMIKRDTRNYVILGDPSVTL